VHLLVRRHVVVVVVVVVVMEDDLDFVEALYRHEQIQTRQDRIDWGIGCRL
jgi:hypothetical protein